jgi:hypothetical protein
MHGTVVLEFCRCPNAKVEDVEEDCAIAIEQEENLVWLHQLAAFLRLPGQLSFASISSALHQHYSCKVNPGVELTSERIFWC